MKLRQLSILLWRNILLKKRNIISTLLEIAVPSVLVLVIGTFSFLNNSEVGIDEVKDIEYFDYDYPELFYRTRNNIFSFIFPNEINKEKQSIFIQNFKSNKIFEKFIFIENDKEFSDVYKVDNEDLNENYEQNSSNLNSSENNGDKVEKRNNKYAIDHNVNDTDVNMVHDPEINHDNHSNPNNVEDEEEEIYYEMKINVFNTELELMQYYKEIRNKYRNKNSPSRIDFFHYGIIFKSATDYELRYMITSGGQFAKYGSLKSEGYSDDDHYYSFLYIMQSIIDQTIVKSLLNNSIQVHITEKVMDQKGYLSITMKNPIKNAIPLFILFYFVPCICILLNHLVTEKESGIKESMVIVGLDKSTFWISWLIIYLFIILFSSSIVTLSMVYFNILQFTHWTVIFTSIFIYGMSCCFIAFILSTFIKKSRTANTLGVMIIVFFFVIYFIDYASENTSRVRQIIDYFTSPLAFLSLLNHILEYEDSSVHISFFNLLRINNMKTCFWGLLTSSFLYFVMAIYLDQVLPQGNGFHKKWYFMITDLYHLLVGRKNNKNRKGRNEDSEFQDAYQDNKYIEKDPEGSKEMVSIHGIRKSFKNGKSKNGNRMEVLKGIEFKTYDNEIFAILGHNGAGKTTLMNILIGILEADQGEVYYEHRPLSSHKQEICKYFGYCPQYDTLIQGLTVGEHIKFFSGIRGIHVETDEILKEIDLLEKRNDFPNELSGGQKRKLCISLALLGSPKYVFLDEPTTGLDPYSRKKIWELLAKKKKDRVIFITTHYMDEADLIADRKMIISEGRISCLGSSLFLKNIFNMNYSLDVYAKDVKDCSLLDSILEQYCPGCVTNKSVSKTSGHDQVDEDEDEDTEKGYIMTYLLPISYSQSFKTLLEGINSLIKDKGNTLQKFSLTSPTLEDIFINLEKRKESDRIDQSMVITMNPEEDEKDLLQKLNPIFSKPQNCTYSSLRQIISIGQIRLKLFFRNKTYTVMYTLIPVVLVLLCLVFMNSALENNTTTYETVDVNPYIYGDIKWFKDTSISNATALEVINHIENCHDVSVDDINFKNDLTLSSPHFRSEANIIGGFSGYENSQQPLDLHFILYLNHTYARGKLIGINMIYNSILDLYQPGQKISTTYESIYSSLTKDEVYTDSMDDQGIDFSQDNDRYRMESILILAICFVFALIISLFGSLTVKEREQGIIHQLLLNGAKIKNYWKGILLSDTLCVILSLSLVFIIGCVNEVDLFSGKSMPYMVLITVLWMIGSLLYQYNAYFFFNNFEKHSIFFTILHPIMILIIGSFSIAFYTGNNMEILSLIRNNEDRASTLEFWNSLNRFYQVFLILVLIFFTPGVIIPCYMKLSSFISFIKANATDEEISKFMLSQKAMDIMNMKNVNINKRYELLSKIFFKEKIPSFTDTISSNEGFLSIIILMVIIIIFYAVVLYLFEKLKIHWRNKRQIDLYEDDRKEKDKKLEEGPKDVYNEWKRIHQKLDTSSSDALQHNTTLMVHQLNKNLPMKEKDMKKRNKNLKQFNEKLKRENNNNNNNNNYDNNNDNDNNKLSDMNTEEPEKNKTPFEIMDDRVFYDRTKGKFINRIVDDVTFEVDVGECLGLLGPNGAGKTTTISMMTGHMSCTHGDIVYGNRKLDDLNLTDISLGYCPQFNPLWKLLTVKETVQFYLSLRGHPKKNISELVDILLKLCSIEEHANKRVNEISGGTKRKLSFIVSICSSPDYLILDEPSAGMDPFTRRYLWNVILNLKRHRGTALILTTHSTEEAEALCDRIAILIKGNLVSIDTPMGIKMNYGNRYILEVFTNHPDQFENEIVQKDNLFNLENPTDYRMESFIEYQKYYVEIDPEHISDVFCKMENAKKSGLIKQYNFGQSSLEQVFINFVNQNPMFKVKKGN